MSKNPIFENTIIKDGEFVGVVKNKGSTFLRGEATTIAEEFFTDKAYETLYIPSAVESIDFSNQPLDIKRIVLEYRCNTSYTVIDNVIYNKDETVLIKASKYVTSHTLSPNTKVIAPFAFNGCDKLESVVLNDGLKEIGKESFRNCSSLKKVDIPESVETIGVRAFKLCKGLKEINLPSSITKISAGCFSYCTTLENLSLPQSITLLDTEAFRNCSSLANIKFNDVLKEIGESAFAYCGFDHLDLPHSLKVIQSKAFSNCENLKDIVIPDNVVIMFFSVFEYCTKLEKAKLSSNLPFLPNDTFFNCSSLKEVIGYDIFDKITLDAFGGCTSLPSINIGANVTEIEPRCDPTEYVPSAECYNVVISKDNPIYESVDGVIYNKKDNTIFFVPGNLKDVRIKEGVKVIHKDDIRYINTETLYIPSSVESIEINGSLEKLREITISPENKYYEVKDGLLYKKGQSFPIIIPQTFKGPFRIPEDFEFSDSFGLPTLGIETIIFPKNFNDIANAISAEVFYEFLPHLKRFEVEEGDSFRSTYDGVMYNYDKSNITIIPNAYDGYIKFFPNTKDVNNTYIGPSVKGFDIDPENKYFGTKGGVLYSIKEHKLVMALACLSSITIPKEVTDVSNLENQRYDNLENIYVEEGNPCFYSKDGILYSKKTNEQVFIPEKQRW